MLQLTRIDAFIRFFTLSLNWLEQNEMESQVYGSSSVKAFLPAWLKKGNWRMSPVAKEQGTR